MRAGLSVRRPLHRGEVGFAAEFEVAEFESAVAGGLVGVCRDDVLKNGGLIHDVLRKVCVGSGALRYWMQMSAHFSTDAGPRIVCTSSTPVFRASKRYA